MDLFTGTLVRLAPSHDTQYLRLLDSEPQPQLTEARIRKEDETRGLPDGKGFGFDIRALAEDRLLGFVYLGIINWIDRDAWTAIAIGERDSWGQGFGTDAMRITLRYAFSELHLHRVTLSVFSNNTRAIRSYEKAGFRHEGRIREAMRRDGAFFDILQMGILRAEWQG